jgi:hypothetical protein
MLTDANERNLIEICNQELKLKKLSKDALVIERLINELHEMRRSGSNNARLTQKINDAESELENIEDEIAKISKAITQLKTHEVY